MRTNNTNSQDLASSEALAQLVNAPTDIKWVRQWFRATTNRQISLAIAKPLLCERLCDLFDDAPQATVLLDPAGKLVINRFTFEVAELYQTLSKLRTLRAIKRAGYNKIAQGSSAVDMLVALEEDIAKLKQIERYIRALDLESPATIIALGGDPDLPVAVQKLTIYFLSSSEGRCFFSDLPTQAWMQDFWGECFRPENRAVVTSTIEWDLAGLWPVFLRYLC